MTKLLNLIIGSIALAGATAQECSSCILNPDMEWCHDAGGYCLEIGTGCTKTRATCTSSIDCDCSDCSSSYTCGATWEGEVVAHAYKRGTGCKTLDKPEVIQKTTKIKRMDDNRASCLFQTNTGSTEGSWTKWTCSDDVGGTATSERCNDEECMDCPNIPDVNTVTLVAGSGVCLANPDTTVTTGFDYMLIPPEGTGNARKNFENAMPICMRDITAPTPAPPPPAPTPTPATTCDACVQDDSMQWCWDDNRCAKPGESGCLGGPDVATVRSRRTAFAIFLAAVAAANKLPLLSSLAPHASFAVHQPRGLCLFRLRQLGCVRWARAAATGAGNV